MEGEAGIGARLVKKTDASEGQTCMLHKWACVLGFGLIWGHWGGRGAWWHGGGGLDVGSTGVEAVGVWRPVWGGCWAGVGRIWVGHGAGIGWAWDAGGFMPRGEGLGAMRMCGGDGFHGAIFCTKQ